MDAPVLVFGATGKQGGATVRHLRARGIPVRAVTRNPQGKGGQKLIEAGVEVVRADLDDPATLGPALAGCRGVFSVQNPWEGRKVDEAAQGIRLTEAAVAAGVPQLVFASVIRADSSPNLPHFANKAKVEDHLKSTALSWTILRPTFFMDNLTDPQGARMMWSVLRHFLGDRVKLQMIACDDIGAAAAAAFADPDGWRGQTLDLAGDELSWAEARATWARVTGAEPPHLPVPAMWLISPLVRLFMDEAYRMFAWYGEASQFHVDIAALRTGQPALHDFEAFARAPR